ncbi:uncharacterized protein LACBIDRAFT_300294 [Laccaria bicolor S238N-H82]|uniref:Predicted protein n=1 Tax=Laccaria bicolor (strain S238N-H82 / ATCC MYA-4686) TaxID=486041 RepID=B0DGF1_LACBS|nr:uncharacterized protein LACBIDRAFT_300294 [Laccaria bicolor S238N-H82]EDR06259.1 predicted protein [Laccaria bicolor S238N-H82]|eukprot:XP_001883120.1 predicted protein [Laccaria bicolor S238N-H82]
MLRVKGDELHGIRKRGSVEKPKPQEKLAILDSHNLWEHPSVPAKPHPNFPDPLPSQSSRRLKGSSFRSTLSPAKS